MSRLGGIFHTAFGDIFPERFVNAIIRIHVTRLTKRLATISNGCVLSGPFTGMKILDDVSWGLGNHLPKLLGSYEAELHQVLYGMPRFGYTDVIDIGCAEGYYAVGMARLLPSSIIHAFDINNRALAVCKQSARANDVLERLRIGGKCTTESLQRLIPTLRRPLLISDCEGAEAHLLDPVKVPSLSRCDLLVETHDCFQPGISLLLWQRLAPSHDIEEICCAGRDTNIYEELRDWPERDRWLVVNENRLAGMTWLFCRSKEY